MKPEDRVLLVCFSPQLGQWLVSFPSRGHHRTLLLLERPNSPFTSWGFPPTFVSGPPKLPRLNRGWHT